MSDTKPVPISDFDKAARTCADIMTPDMSLAEKIQFVATMHSLDPRLFASQVQTESSRKQSSLSPKGAVGLMQIVPAVWASEHTPADQKFDALSLERDADYNLCAGAIIMEQYLYQAQKKFPHADPVMNYERALAAYNSGPSFGFDRMNWEDAPISHAAGVPRATLVKTYVHDVFVTYYA